MGRDMFILGVNGWDYGSTDGTGEAFQNPIPHLGLHLSRGGTDHQVQFDDQHMIVDLSDGRRLAVPLWWIPTLHHAAPEERLKFEISRDRTALIWDPEKCAINEDLRIADYLGPVDAHVGAEE